MLPVQQNGLQKQPKSPYSRKGTGSYEERVDRDVRRDKRGCGGENILCASVKLPYHKINK